MKIKRISSAKTSETAIHFHRTSEVDNNDYRTKHCQENIRWYYCFRSRWKEAERKIQFEFLWKV